MSDVNRRDTLKLLAATGASLGAAAAGGCVDRGQAAPVGKRSDRTVDTTNSRAKAGAGAGTAADVEKNAIVEVGLLGFPWATVDPFLFCVHHDDRYPAGNERFGPAPSLLSGRNIGNDFEGKGGWRMYHGDVVPGFPQHPHRGFETVTVVRRGLLDHSDSLGASARYGGGDVQWLTAGRGILHAEMFPLLDRKSDNPVELFQIWLNLPSANKMVDPHFSMLWNGSIPRRTLVDDEGRRTELTIVAGRYGEGDAGQVPPPPPKSWASAADNDVAIWTIKMEPGARWTLPAARTGTNRALYFFRGGGLKVAGRDIPAHRRIVLRPDFDVPLTAGLEEVELLLLQGRPIKEPVVQYGPFVMNSPDEIRQAFADYQRTQFGGWPWKQNDPVHGSDRVRFARLINGTTERPAT